MTFRYHDLFQKDDTKSAANHKAANWNLVGFGDTIKCPNTISYSVVYATQIMAAAKSRATRLGITLLVTKDEDFIYYHFGKQHFTGNNKGLGMPPPKHIGQGYKGEDKICPFPATFGKITSINFYKNGDETE